MIDLEKLHKLLVVQQEQIADAKVALADIVHDLADLLSGMECGLKEHQKLIDEWNSRQ